MCSRSKTFKADKKLWYILGVALLLILIRISQVDFLGDNAHYAIRAVGYVDTMFSEHQATPLNWFEELPGWANFSFHDHPPLLFFVQHVFLSIHESIFFAKLAYILFSLGTVVVVYRWAKESYGEKVAFWAALLLSINCLFLFTVRTGYMEAGVIFFITLALYFFLRFLKDEKYWPHFGILLGLCLLAKYSTFFLIPSILVYIFFQNRGILKKRKIYYAFFTALLVASPIIVYNVMMYKATGHFDYQFSRLFGVDNPWVDNSSGLSIGSFKFVITLGQSVLFPYLLLSVAGLGLALYKKKMALIAFSLVFLTLMFFVTGAGIYHLNLYNIFLVMPLSYLIVSLQSWKKVSKIESRIIIWFFAVYLGAVAINSHILITPVAIESQGWLISVAQSKNVGIYQLDRYIENIIEQDNIMSVHDGYGELKSKKPSLLRRYGTRPEALTRSARDYKDIIVYDDNLNWFVELWPFKRRRFYHNLPIMSTSEFVKFSEEISTERIYFIKATENTFLESGVAWSEFPDQFEQSILDSGVDQADSIFRTDGKEAFRVYIFDSE